MGAAGVIRFIIDHPYVFGLTLAALGVYVLIYCLWWRATGTDFIADIEDDVPT